MQLARICDSAQWQLYTYPAFPEDCCFSLSFCKSLLAFLWRFNCSSSQLIVIHSWQFQDLCWRRPFKMTPLELILNKPALQSPLRCGFLICWLGICWATLVSEQQAQAPGPAVQHWEQRRSATWLYRLQSPAWNAQHEFLLIKMHIWTQNHTAGALALDNAAALWPTLHQTHPSSKIKC